MTTTDIIRDIRKRCRLAMNGVVSSGMRDKGLNYKLNFGVSLNKIKEIAAHYQPDKDLSEALWKEDVRELKILATLLYPSTMFTENEAERWVQEIPNQEIREQVCLNLFSKLPFAEELVFKWSASNNENIRATGYWLLVRLFLSKIINSEFGYEKLTYIFEDIVSPENISLRNAALLALKHIGRSAQKQADSILEHLNQFNESDNPLEKEILDSLKFEYDFYFDR
ncbi:hypothetical protein D0T53_07325 [Dysgonomonas sp. 216]|uniref:DNA alkylation repair protein n=1 Tax=Dysgonomonas sp. 216 TaxID=2302934 RepID=UPI0013D07228|nr:DNA alkylation repair protein [Dysgonomonas sp. 216]NDW18355.1 hypothetical protein [Dysgonomonas sp. 216]NDW18723.1 hypothetical protein [Dysgonomonas sp. 216]